VVCFIDTTGVNPKVFQAIIFGLLSAKPDLIKTSLTLSGTIHEIFESDLLALFPDMRKDRIGRDRIIVYHIISEAVFASVAAF
jgi:hypothetical protein